MAQCYQCSISGSQLVTDYNILQDLVSHVSTSLTLPDPITAEEYVCVDAEVVASEELSATWEQDLLDQFINP